MIEPYYNKDNIIIYNENCFNILPNIKKKSIDLILTDMPYNITVLDWDKNPINLNILWNLLKPIGKENAAYVFTASQPFTSKLVMSNLKWFRYEWIWQKSNPSNISQANKRPLKYHEDVLVFYKKQPIYNKQMIRRMESGKKVIQDYQTKRVTFKHGATEHNKKNTTTEYDAKRYDPNFKNPSSVIYFKSERCHPRLHPTQKPVPLMEYFIKTYTNEGDIVLDPFMGSGTTLVAAKRLKRKAIGIEISKKYCDIAIKRLEVDSNGI